MQARPNPEGPTSRRLSHIDGLLAGFNVLVSDCPIDRQKQPWDRLEELRGEMQRQWERLRDVPLAVEDLEGFCETAFFAYRNALAGLVPTDLPKVVGLCSLSYAVSRITERERTPSSEKFLDDVQVCLQSLERQEDRQRIEASMQQLWPATTQASHVQDDSLVTHQHQDWPYFSSSSAYPTTPSSQSWQIQDAPSLSYTSTAFDALPGLAVPAHWAHTPDRCLESQGPAVDTPDFSVFNSIPGGTMNLMPATSWSGFQVGSLGQLEPTSQPRVVSSAPNAPQHLQDTELFKAIGIFIDGLSGLLTLLSGNGTTAKNLDSCLSSNQERSKDKECLQSLYMEPLLKRSELSESPYPTILSITQKFVGYGFLQSVDEAQYYMRTVAEVSRLGPQNPARC